MRQFPQLAFGLSVVTSFAIATVAQANPIPSNHPTVPVLNNSSILLFPPYRDLVEMSNNQDSFSRNYAYFLYQAGKPPLEVVVERDGDRLLLVQRPLVGKRMLKKRKQALAAFQPVGLPSRVFPGLTGFQKIPPETVRLVSIGAFANNHADKEPSYSDLLLAELLNNVAQPDLTFSPVSGTKNLDQRLPLQID